jgi:hypothetical protein
MSLSVTGWAYGELEKKEQTDLTCLRAELHIAQKTADLARTEADLRALDPDEECDLACAANERHRSVLMSEIRDEHKVLRERGCKKGGDE